MANSKSKVVGPHGKFVSEHNQHTVGYVQDVITYIEGYNNITEDEKKNYLKDVETILIENFQQWGIEYTPKYQ